MQTNPTTSRPGILGNRDDLAYILPMVVFLIFTWAGGQSPAYYPWSYVAKTIVVAAMLIVFRGYFTPIRWNHWWLGIIVGVIGIVQWVGMEKLLLAYWPSYPRMSAEPYLPFEAISPPGLAWSFVIIRWAGASLLVPFMEELFWRDYLWRSFIAPADFKLAKVGEWSLKAFLLVALVFGGAVHIQWMTAIVWGAMIGWLLVYTRSIGACIIAHGVTNFLLGAYVLVYKDWAFW